MTDYGVDVSTFPDLDLTFAPITGLRVVGEAVARRWYVELIPFLNAKIDSGFLGRIRPKLEQAALADERVDTCDVELSVVGGSVKARGTITAVEGETFTLVFDVSELTLESFGAA